jgi:hypothetical protein
MARDEAVMIPEGSHGAMATDAILVRRLHQLGLIVVLTLPTYTVLDYLSGQPYFWTLQAIKLITLLALGLALYPLRRESNRALARPIAVLLVSLAGIASGVSSYLAGDYLAHGLLCVIVPLLMAAFFPWGVRMQVLGVAIVAASGVAATGSRCSRRSGSSSRRTRAAASASDCTSFVNSSTSCAARSSSRARSGRGPPFASGSPPRRNRARPLPRDAHRRRDRTVRADPSLEVTEKDLTRRTEERRKHW